MSEALRPIGVFDSGIGGLTAVREIVKLLPRESILYFGDTARVPYGTRSHETIVHYAKQDLKLLLAKDVKAVLVACGTVSSHALPALRAMTEIPVLGVIDASARKAAEKCRNGRVAVIATSATIRSSAYARAIHGIAPELEVREKACPLFVPLIENGYADSENPVTRMVASDYLEELVRFAPDTVILGCTHYPIIKPIIQDFFPDAYLVESGKEAALELAGLLRERELITGQEGNGETTFVLSEETESFHTTGELFLGRSVQGKLCMESAENYTY